MMFRLPWRPPAPDQERVVRAALGLDRSERTYDWLMTRYVEGQLGEAERRLLPLVHVHLEATFPGHPGAPVLGRLHWEHTVRNALLLAQLADVVDVLRSRGVETLVLKGGALATSAYPTVGSRPMADIDLMVLEAVDIPDILDALATRDAVLRKVTAHAWTFDSPRWEGSLDVHRYLSKETSFRGSTEPLWTQSTPVLIRGTACRVLSPEHQFVHLICHGLPAAAGGRLRWIVDAALVRRRDRFDADSCRSLAQALRLNDTVHDGWTYLHSLGLAEAPGLLPADAPLDARLQVLLQDTSRSAALRVHYVTLPRRLHSIERSRGGSFEVGAYYRSTLGMTEDDRLLPVVARKGSANLGRVIRAGALRVPGRAGDQSRASANEPSDPLTS